MIASGAVSSAAILVKGTVREKRIMQKAAAMMFFILTSVDQSPIAIQIQIL